MQRAGTLFGKISQARQELTTEELAKSAWPAAVGKKIAARTRASGMVRSTLIVEVEDLLWKRNLFLLHGQILRSLEKVIGKGIVGDIRFRVGGLESRQPQREQRIDPEAGAIEDPILRRLYVASRKNSAR